MSHGLPELWVVAFRRRHTSHVPKRSLPSSPLVADSLVITLGPRMVEACGTRLG